MPLPIQALLDLGFSRKVAVLAYRLWKEIDTENEAYRDVSQGEYLHILEAVGFLNSPL